MPELPEVETTRRGIEPHINKQTVTKVIVRNASLRWPIDAESVSKLNGQTIQGVERRAKYLLVQFASGTLIIHLGMSGSLSVLPKSTEAKKHDHFELQFQNNLALRLNDPRRFGAVLWTDSDIATHKLIQHLGPEPLDKTFNAERLFELSRNRKLTVKQFIMDGKIVVGVGNIYASESLYAAGIDPRKAAGKVSMKSYSKLCTAIKQVISKAIIAGGTSLQDFTQPDGKPGYFAQKLNVYGRTGLTCNDCDATIKQVTIGQRSTFYCNQCQR